MDVPDNLICLFSARAERRNGSLVFDLPSGERAAGAIDEGATYRVAVFPAAKRGSAERSTTVAREPPVEVGDVRDVTIEGLGDQGDGIARVDRGYVVIVPETDVGDEVTVEIESLHDNFAIGRVIEAPVDD